MEVSMLNVYTVVELTYVTKLIAQSSQNELSHEEYCSLY